MTLISLFIDFIEKILRFKILGYSIYSFLIGFVAAIFIFKIINIVGNTSKKEKNDK